MLKKEIVTFTVFLIGTICILFISYLRTLPDGLLHIVFCDVGQGDAIYIKLPDGQDVLIDGGPSKDVLNCLGEHMSFWDRSIEMVLLSHPQKDHYGGLNETVRRYKIGKFIVSPIGNEVESFQELIGYLRDKNIPIQNVYKGDVIRLSSNQDELYFEVFWPERSWISQRIDLSDKKNVMLNEDILGIAMNNEDLNNFSIVGNLHYKLFDTLFTGDINVEILKNLTTISKSIEVLKIPHHGSLTGLNQNILKDIKPDLSIISVGKSNSYGHPRQEVLNMLRSEDIPFKRTDIDGEIEIVSDGEKWWVKK